MNITTANHMSVGERLYRTFAESDVPGLVDLLHPDVVLDVPGRHPLAGRSTGVEGVLGFLGRSRAIARETIEVVDLLAGERHVAGLCIVRGEREGRAPMENQTVHVFELADDGRVVAIRFHNADQGVVDAFWG